MKYNEITEEMWHKIKAEGIDVLEYENGTVNFVSDYFVGDKPFIHNGDELDKDLENVVSTQDGWTNKWQIVKRPESMVKPTINLVVEWLDKYVYVFDNSNEVGGYTYSTNRYYLPCHRLG